MEALVDKSYKNFIDKLNDALKVNFANLSCCRKTDTGQGPKLTFLGRCQLATEIFFQSPDGKMWSPKRVFPLQRNTNRWKILVANFSFRNRNEENAFGAATAIFPITKRLAMENHDKRIMLATCAVSCNYRKCFKSTLYLLLRPTEKLSFGSLVCS